MKQRAMLLGDDLSAKRKQLLDEIGFPWSSEIIERKWREMYQRLKDYHAEYGDADVPNRWNHDSKLAAWVSHQRERNKKCNLSEEQKGLLTALGFTWKHRDRGRWEDSLEAIAQFKALYGHCEIPLNYLENPKLGRFINQTRNQRNRGVLSSDRIAKLDALGFVWASTKYRIGEDGMNGVWKSRFDELVTYKQIHGNCEVPFEWKENTPLANWVSAQRRLKKSGDLHSERIKLLEEIGFTWELGGSRQPWEVRYAELLEFKKIHKSCDVPTEYPANPSLDKWVSKQRQNKKDNKLSPEQERLLNEAGFIWEKRSSQRG